MFGKAKVYVLQKDDELWMGEVKSQDYDYDHKIIAALSPEQETVDDIIEAVNNQDFPWNFDYYRDLDLKVETDYSKEDFGFTLIDDIDLERLDPDKLTNIPYVAKDTDNKRIFIDLQHNKVFSLGTARYGFDPQAFPRDLKVKTYNAFISTDPAGDFREKRSIPEGFTPITIELYSRRDDSELQVATELLKELRECNHPSGKFFRSLGACVDQHYFWELYWEEVRWRRATSAELRERSTCPERIVESTIRGRIMKSLPQRIPKGKRVYL